MDKEISTHDLHNRWKVLLQTSANGKKVLKSIQVFKRKRDPNGTLNKHKARIYPHEGIQQWGIDFQETYSPIVSQLIIRLIFAFCVARKYDSISLDFNQAFTQVDIKSDIYMEIPAGYKNVNNSYVLKLKKNFCRLSNGNLTWYKYCAKGLKARGFKSSKTDSYLFYKEGIVLMLYVNDCYIFGTSKEKINKL